jgi:hypothetical protein
MTTGRTLKIAGIAVLTCATLAVAQQITGRLALTVGGFAAADQAIVVGGKTYYPESALKALGIGINRSGNTVALTGGVSGGANQTAALEGCIGEWLFNGAARVKLWSFTPLMVGGKATGWTADLEFRNGTNTTNNLYGLGQGGGATVFIAYPDDSTYPFYLIDSNGVSSSRDIPPGSSYRVKVNFGPSTSNAEQLPFDPSRKPTKLLLGFNKSQATAEAQKTMVANPSFRIRLDCQK